MFTEQTLIFGFDLTHRLTALGYLSATFALLTSLSLSFLLCKIGVITESGPQCSGREKWDHRGPGLAGRLQMCRMIETMTLAPRGAHVLSRFSHVGLCDPMDGSPPNSSVHGILQARMLEWVAMPFSRDLPDTRIEPGSPAL